MGSRVEKDWKSILTRHGQEHVWRHLQALDPPRRAGLERELDGLDFQQLDALIALVSSPPAEAPGGEIRPPSTVRKGADRARDAAMDALGRDLLASGKVACVLVAGGQGSRLKHPGPKGTFPATPVRRKSLFQLFAEKLRARSLSSGHPITLAIMTSEENDAETRAFFRDHRWFGVEETHVRFFTQGMLPAVDPAGKLVLRAPGALFLSPNGHGGTLLALRQSGLVDSLASEGVEEVFYFQVDNPLVDICDPVFLGYHRSQESEFSSKVVAKDGPAEKVGVLAERDGRMTLIEYSDLPASLREARGRDGMLLFSAGNIAIHALRLDFIRRLTDGGLHLPFHMARKSLAITGTDGAAREVPGIKFETFIFDALGEARKPLALEVPREDEFAPIKNATGPDSIETSAAMQIEQAARTLAARGVTVPRNAAGRSKVPIEIAPLLAADSARFDARIENPLSFEGPLYLGDD